MKAITLSNEVELTSDGRMTYRSNVLHRQVVREIFIDRSRREAFCPCTVCPPESDCGDHYAVRYDGDYISVGCVEFHSDDIAKVKEWLSDEDQTIASQPGQSAQRDDNAQSPAQSGDQGNDEQRNAPADAPENVAGEAEAPRTTETSGD